MIKRVEIDLFFFFFWWSVVLKTNQISLIFCFSVYFIDNWIEKIQMFDTRQTSIKRCQQMTLPEKKLTIVAIQTSKRRNLQEYANGLLFNDAMKNKYRNATVSRTTLSSCLNENIYLTGNLINLIIQNCHFLKKTQKYFFSSCPQTFQHSGSCTNVDINGIIILPPSQAVKSQNIFIDQMLTITPWFTILNTVSAVTRILNYTIVAVLYSIHVFKQLKRNGFVNSMRITFVRLVNIEKKRSSIPKCYVFMIENGHTWQRQTSKTP